MPVSAVFMQNFRLFEERELSLSNLNCLIKGQNGSGKTTCLEAINLLLTRKSSRTRNLTECIKRNQEGFLLGLQGSIKNQGLKIHLRKSLNERVAFKAELNNKTVKNNEISVCQFIQAKNLRFIEGEPELRRDLFSSIMFHVEHESYLISQRYKRTLNQRNTVLKRRGSGKELNIWTDRLIEEGLELKKKHKEFFKNFYDLSMEIVNDISTEEGLFFLKGMKVKLDRGWGEEISFKESLYRALEKDKILGYTTTGPHKLDLKFYIQGKIAKSVLSRGQQKLLTLLIYFKMDNILNESNDAGSICLIDDISSELDRENLRIILERIILLKSQVVITAIGGEKEEIETPLLSQFNQINL